MCSPYGRHDLMFRPIASSFYSPIKVSFANITLIIFQSLYFNQRLSRCVYPWAKATAILEDANAIFLCAGAINDTNDLW